MKTAGIMGGGFLYSWTCSWIAHYILYILNKWIWHVLRQFYYKCLIVWYHEFSQNFAMQTKIIWTVLTHNHGAIQTDTPLVTMIYLSDPGQTWLQWSVKKWEMEEKKEGNVRLPAKKKKLHIIHNWTGKKCFFALFSFLIALFVHFAFLIALYLVLTQEAMSVCRPSTRFRTKFQRFRTKFFKKWN